MDNIQDLKVGDLIKIPGVNCTQLVIACGMTRSESYDGAYFGYELTTINKPKRGVPKENPKIRQFYANGFSMRGAGDSVDAKDITVVGKATYKVRTTTSYRLTKVINAK